MKCKNCGKKIEHDGRYWIHSNEPKFYNCSLSENPEIEITEMVDKDAEPYSKEEIIKFILNNLNN